jgi:hypothetical protein
MKEQNVHTIEVEEGVVCCAKDDSLTELVTAA